MHGWGECEKWCVKIRKERAKKKEGLVLGRTLMIGLESWDEGCQPWSGREMVWGVCCRMRRGE